RPPHQTSWRSSAAPPRHRSRVTGINAPQPSRCWRGTSRFRNASRSPLTASCKAMPVLERRPAGAELSSLAGHEYGVLGPLLDDPSLSEVMVNGIEPVSVERAGKMTRSEV